MPNIIRPLFSSQDSLAFFFHSCGYSFHFPTVYIFCLFTYTSQQRKPLFFSSNVVVTEFYHSRERKREKRSSLSQTRKSRMALNINISQGEYIKPLSYTSFRCSCYFILFFLKEDCWIYKRREREKKKTTCWKGFGRIETLLKGFSISANR